MSSAGIEKKALKLGYMPLSDCLPLIVAQQQGFFEQQGLDVELQQEVSWANIRDKVIVGHLDGAHMLAPMLLASSLGLAGIKKNLITAFSLGLNGNAFTVSNDLYAELSDISKTDTSTNSAAIDQASTFKQLIAQRKQQGKKKPVIATVYPYSCHSLQLRYWLASADIDPDCDIELVVLPPSQMVDHLKLKHIDGFFAGAPWNSVAILNGHGHCLITSPDIWQSAPEKVFGVTEEWATLHPNTHEAILKALYHSCEWIENNTETAIPLLAQQLSINSPFIDEQCIAPAITGDFVYGKNMGPTRVENMLVFHRGLANFPWLSHAQWIAEQMQAWQWLPASTDVIELSNRCYRPDIYRSALQNLAPLPSEDKKDEGHNDQNWSIETSTGTVSMIADSFINKATYSF